MPDAIGNLRPSAEVLTDLAQAKLEQVVAERSGLSPTVVVNNMRDEIVARRRS
ncbi:hypothetical protein [Paracoccus kondratievae]|uniref:hypothetical protein n=1 Tax=Paracoccus kondratievae TaxID=135740 RepID=UPI0022F26A11|nr:hypothetical protein [Paracoccus kondratievae]